jgi:hypothetical protein
VALIKFKLEGAGALDGDYEVDRFPTTRELVAFRKDAGLSPKELQEVFEEGGVEQLPMFAWVSQFRKGRLDLAAQVLDLPYDQWGGIKAEGDEDEPEDPTSGSASGSRTDAPIEPSGETSPSGSES